MRQGFLLLAILGLYYLTSTRPAEAAPASPLPSDLQWSVGSHSIESDDLHSLQNTIIDRYLHYGERTFGINLVWGDHERSRVLFENCTRPGDPIYDSDLIAISVHRLDNSGGHYLTYQERDFGINLDWSDKQACEFRLISSPGSGFGPTAAKDGRFAIYNIRVGAYLIYGERTFGINLVWREATAPTSIEARVDFVPDSMLVTEALVGGQFTYTGYLYVKNQGNVASTTSRAEMKIRVAGKEMALVIPQSAPVRPSGTARLIFTFENLSLLDLCTPIPVEVDTEKVFQNGRGVFANDSRTILPQQSSSAVECRGSSVSVHFQDQSAPAFFYTGANDASLARQTPGERLGGSATCLIDGDDPPGTGRDLVTLLRWNLQPYLSPGMKVQRAAINLTVTDVSQDEYAIYGLRRDWVEAEATWRAFRNGQRWQVSGAAGPQDREQTALGTLRAPAQGQITIELNQAGIATVQSWIDNPSQNFGLAIANPDAVDGVDFLCRETNSRTNRPRLTIELAR